MIASIIQLSILFFVSFFHMLHFSANLQPAAAYSGGNGFAVIELFTSES
ncbi:MAG: hypothetical protein H6695_11590 [Deferribacteres bacterium]|nr:hypothetical protein [candidate division KSB1 bacterium]MCB9510821.1 hypothetical protein [Deferribacteres bacterium]